jgi:hypothetical protein
MRIVVSLLLLEGGVPYLPEVYWVNKHTYLQRCITGQKAQKNKAAHTVTLRG